MQRRHVSLIARSAVFVLVFKNLLLVFEFFVFSNFKFTRILKI